MKLILTYSIKKDEFEFLSKTFPIEAIKIAAKKSLQGLGENIKSSKKISGTVEQDEPFFYCKFPLKDRF